MTLRVSSSETRPRFEPHRYRPSPARQRWINGPLQPMHAPRIPWAKLITGAVWVVCTAYAVKLWVVGG